MHDWLQVYTRCSCNYFTINYLFILLISGINPHNFVKFRNEILRRTGMDKTSTEGEGGGEVHMAEHAV